MGRKFYLVTFAVRVLCAVVIVICSLLTLWAVGPVLETQLMPAVSKLKIVSIEERDGKSAVRVEFTKLRNCEYVGLAWYRGTRETGFERVSVILLREPGDDSSPNRPVGFQRAGPWVIDVPPAELPGNSFAELHHRCHPFWTTVTQFWP